MEDDSDQHHPVGAAAGETPGGHTQNQPEGVIPAADPTADQVPPANLVAPPDDPAQETILQQYHPDT